MVDAGMRMCLLQNQQETMYFFDTTPHVYVWVRVVINMQSSRAYESRDLIWTWQPGKRQELLGTEAHCIIYSSRLSR